MKVRLSLLLLGLLAAVDLCLWCQANAGWVRLEWDAISKATGYRVYQSRDGAAFEKVMDVTATNATVTLATNAVSTRFYVTSWNTAGESGPSNTVTNVVPIVTEPPPEPPTAPGAPEIIGIQRINGNRLDVAIATKDLTSTTQVWRSMEGSSWRLMTTLAPSVLHWSDTGAQQRKAFAYRAASCNQFGCSPFSVEAEFPPK